MLDWTIFLVETSAHHLHIEYVNYVKVAKDSMSLHSQQSTSVSVKDLLLKLNQILNDKGLTVGFAESCTGGLLSSELTKIPGVSQVFKGSVVCYANELKERLLGVDPVTLQKFGAVSKEVAIQMVMGAKRNLSVDVAASITGIAGPDGGSAMKPVGTVFIAVVGGKNEAEVFHHQFSKETTRESIQKAAMEKTLEHLIEILGQIKD